MSNNKQQTEINAVEVLGWYEQGTRMIRYVNCIGCDRKPLIQGGKK